MGWNGMSLICSIFYSYSYQNYNVFLIKVLESWQILTKIWNNFHMKSVHRMLRVLLLLLLLLLLLRHAFTSSHIAQAQPVGQGGWGGGATYVCMYECMYVCLKKKSFKKKFLKNKFLKKKVSTKKSFKKSFWKKSF